MSQCRKRLWLGIFMSEGVNDAYSLNLQSPHGIAIIAREFIIYPWLRVTQSTPGKSVLFTMFAHANSKHPL